MRRVWVQRIFVLAIILNACGVVDDYEPSKATAMADVAPIVADSPADEAVQVPLPELVTVYHILSGDPLWADAMSSVGELKAQEPAESDQVIVESLPPTAFATQLPGGMAPGSLPFPDTQPRSDFRVQPYDRFPGPLLVYLRQPVLLFEAGALNGPLASVGPGQSVPSTPSNPPPPPSVPPPGRGVPEPCTIVPLLGFLAVCRFRR
jgi:hypothetical protein